ncbi:MAG: glycoside hydrolase family 3 N-terminal domain-containing protein [Mycoplasmatales bacterium]
MKVDINKLLEEMTLQEKIGQLVHPFSDLILDYQTNNEARKQVNLEDEKIFTVGSISGLGNPPEMRKLQRLILEKSRLKIPVLNMMDVVHGYTTNYQIALGLGCSFDPEQVKQLSRTSGYEAAINGIHVTYSPMADLTTDPRWGRFMEVPSEDPLLTADYIKAIVEGFQNNLSLKNGDIAACVKHFAGYGLAEGGRDYGSADVSKQQLYEKHFKPYLAGINANSKLVMTAFNTLDGVACTGNYELLRTILREKFGFEGVIISDHSSVQELVNHGHAKDRREAAKIAIKCGVDIELATTCYAQYLEDLVLSGEVELKYINESVERVLKLKAELGLFEHPFAALDEEKAKELYHCQSHAEAYTKANIDSFVLLKNQASCLPISKAEKIALIGTHVDSQDLIGFNACRGYVDQVVTIKEYFKQKQAKFIDVHIANFEQTTAEELHQVTEVIEQVETVVMPIGEQSRWSGEGVSRADIKLPASQTMLVKQIKAAGKKVVLLIFAGRPLDLSDVNELVDAILYVWFPGHQAAAAIYQAIYGEANITGKLSCSLPRSVGQIPIYYNHLPTGREKKFFEQEYVNGYRDLANEPLYPFGFGLSYSTYKYANFKVVDNLTYSIDVENTSNVDGHEIVQLYIRDLVADVSRPVLELKKYHKIKIKAGEKVTVVFKLTLDDLKYYNNRLEYKFDDGEFLIGIGPSSVELISKIVEIKN